MSNFIYAIDRVNKWYIYWGSHRSFYVNSDIIFTKDGSNFLLKDVKAHDLPNPWSDLFSHYLNPFKMTVPPFNFRIGYYINNNVSLSLGMNHLKYVVDGSKIANMIGTLDGQNYNGKKIDSFLSYEHTNGYNIISSDVDYIDTIYFNNTVDISLFTGVGIGIVYPKSAVKLKNYDLVDKFNISGVDISAKVGTEFTFYQSYICRLILRGGHSNMFNVLTTKNGGKAEQDIYHLSISFVLGYRF